MISLIISILALIIALCSFIFRKPGPKGNDGKDGKDGVDGNTPIFTISEGNLYVHYMDYSTGIATDKVKLGYIEGEKGEKGDKGEMGEPGPKGEPGKDGVDGKDGEVILKEAGDLTGSAIEKLLQRKKYLKLPNTQIYALAFHESENE